jgi:hypothetical protein
MAPTVPAPTMSTGAVDGCWDTGCSSALG